MLDIEVIGTQGSIASAKRDIASLAGMPVREFQHRGAGGEAGIAGIVTSIPFPILGKLLDILRRLVAADRDLKIVANGFELHVRDVKEADDVLTLLKTRGLLPKEG
jgi:hypothetical protein